MGDHSEKEIGTLELCMEEDYTSVSTKRYEELIRAEAELNVVQRAYQHCASFDITNVLTAVFGPLPKKDEEHA